jgi:outer membrane protein OmpU
MQTKKVLLGSTAIIGAGMMLLANPTPAQAQIEVTLSGFTEFGVRWADDEDLIPSPNDDKQFHFFMDNEVFFNAQARHDPTGIIYGMRVELEVGTGNNAIAPGQFNAFVDEAVLFVSGAFGRIELGREDGAADIMMLGARRVAAGTGGIDGDLPINLSGGIIIDTSDAAKVTYFTPRIGGFQAGISYSPDSDGFFGAPLATFEDAIEWGANFVGQFVGLDVGLSATAVTSDFLGTDDFWGWQVGGTVGIAGFNLGASFGREDLDVLGIERDIITAGVGFGLGPANASFTWEYNDYDEEPAGVGDSHLFVGSVDFGIFPGMVVKADVGHNTDTPQLAGDSAWAAVVTTQLNW